MTNINAESIGGQDATCILAMSAAAIDSPSGRFVNP
jgi:hypothetical protein